jgi:uncharacterized protein (DUF169 family)
MTSETRGGLKRLLGLEREPVALAWFTKAPNDIAKVEKKARFCAKLALAAQGPCFYSTIEEEECMGGAKYCGLHADAGPICSSMAAIPYLTGKVAYGFGDVGSRPQLKLGPDGVMVSIPGSDLPRIVANLEEMRSKDAFPA